MMILIHGAWHGAFVWQGLGLAQARAVELSAAPEAGLAHHAAQIGAELAASPAWLVGHSYGAAVAQQAAARWPERVLGLIALDGFLLRPGQAVVDLLPPAIRAAWLKSPLVPPLPLDVLAIPPAHREWLAARLRPQPLPCFTETAPDLPPYAGPRHYLRATGFAFPPFDRLAARAAREGCRGDCGGARYDAR